MQKTPSHLLTRIKKILQPRQQKFACFTIDIEPDYGGRTGTTNLITSKSAITRLADILLPSEIPITAFITTDILLSNGNNLIENLRASGIADFHCHSHTHTTTKYSINSTHEISKSFDTLNKFLDKNRIVGYRAPQGLLNYKDIDAIKKTGFHFSSSIFPSFRPQKFNNLKLPCIPFIYDNGLIEFPLAVIKYLKVIFSLSYTKLLGLKTTLALTRLFGLPEIVIIDSHLHDFITDEPTYQKLSPVFKAIYSRNKHNGGDYFHQIVSFLKQQNYKFITMSELYRLYTTEL